MCVFRMGPRSLHTFKDVLVRHYNLGRVSFWNLCLNRRPYMKSLMVVVLPFAVERSLAECPHTTRLATPHVVWAVGMPRVCKAEEELESLRRKHKKNLTAMSQQSQDRHRAEGSRGLRRTADI